MVAYLVVHAAHYKRERDAQHRASSKVMFLLFHLQVLQMTTDGLCAWESQREPPSQLLSSSDGEPGSGLKIGGRRLRKYHPIFATAVSILSQDEAK